MEEHQNSQEVYDNKNEILSNIVYANNNGVNEFLDQSLKWIKTPLCDFGFKCIQSKHDSCDWTKCKCLCHQK